MLPDVTIDEFAKCDMRVCKVLKCEPVKKSDKLLCFTLNDGSGTDRQILSGIAKYYQPEELLGTLRFLIDNDASGFVTGITIPMDGGFSAYSGV